MDHFGERLPIAQMCVTDSELREILIRALLENKKYKLNIPKGCIVKIHKMINKSDLT